MTRKDTNRQKVDILVYVTLRHAMKSTLRNCLGQSSISHVDTKIGDRKRAGSKEHRVLGTFYKALLWVALYELPASSGGTNCFHAC